MTRLKVVISYFIYDNNRLNKSFDAVYEANDMMKKIDLEKEGHEFYRL